MPSWNPELIFFEIKRKYRKFAVSDAKTRIKLIGRGIWYYFILPPLRLVVKLICLFLFPCLSVLRPLWRVRFGILHYESFGHLAINTELFLRRQAMRKDVSREILFFLSGEPANRQLLTMIKRRVPVLEGRRLSQFQDIVKARAKDFDLWVELPVDTNEYDEFNNISPQLSFTEEEEMRGKELLATMGIEPGMSFVCFHARDKAYLDTMHSYRSREEWRYQDYRDCDIHNYLPAAEYLASMEMFAIRMGHIVGAPLCEAHPRVIDYATRYRSDFGDVYLPAKCKFYLGCGSGISALAYVFKRPTASANLIPIRYPPVLKADVFITKRLWHVERKRSLTFREILDCRADKWLRTQEFEQAHIEVVENTADEILALAKEMNERLDGTWVSAEEDEELQARYRALFPPGHHCYGFPSRIGAEFLRQNRELLD